MSHVDDVEEMVREWDSGLYDSIPANSLLHDFVSKLIADWRQRGEALAGGTMIREFRCASCGRKMEPHGPCVCYDAALTPQQPPQAS